ncbi:MAG TPA: Tim44 domain-containing protein [Nitrosomonas nitrosa]|uniref:Predicted lipid-binding transport protein, Tim44 family n=1 Tax=Nitrosomonas nitrosa TaxID=52442 RepID=A0A1I4U3F6_9PROT|nr:Tim44-like domain-containing protein [Nitrosomonas nitrosa]MCO6432851.1 Tim44 domain-containing protein [Nitrosomonas nitrosa]PTQ93681.1 putative lipid-binding transport protein (Tim44 family) [Nitrosomonas nitrosa]CAE6518827.1 Preprotein translocase subunit Tim44 [Nitrosomonas nitrosa]SFM83439.1 Predicted lipid-binding transport protein, Tim44 family [Nitrosomonas nitrosa]HBZ29172.1 Tim44 domain-containing protein [Nitrosomonas nitrosa]
MKKILTLLTLAMFTFTLLPFDAEARRMGGGKSIGKQRDSINQQAAPKPAQSQSATSNSTAAPASAAAAGGASKWGGALAGLAAGGLLAALFMGGAFEGINMADILMLVVLAAVIFFIIRMLRRPRTDQASRPIQFSGAGVDRASGGFTPNTVAPAPAGDREISPVPSDTSGTVNSIPADFEVEPFLRNAKLSFIHLQEANGARDLESIREYTTPEMFAELSAQINDSNDPPQKTEVMFIDANLLDVTVTNDRAIASVRFNGQLRESPDAEPESFDEIWHIQKDLKGRNGAWLLAGIQQPS